MPLIKPKQQSEKEKISINLEQHVVEKIKQYCAWAEIHKMNDFFEQAAEYILSKDKEWIEHNKQQTTG